MDTDIIIIVIRYLYWLYFKCMYMKKFVQSSVINILWLSA